MMRTTKKRDERGFALFIVVILVALLALTGAALLDMVSVDLTLSGEHQKVIRAQMVADGALREVMSDLNSQQRLPTFSDSPCATGLMDPTCPNFRYNWATEVSGVSTKDPDNLHGARAPLTEANSAFAKWTGAPSEESYTATLDIVRVVQMEDTSLINTRAVIYEINTRADIGNGAAFHDVAAEVYKVANEQPGVLLPRQHFR